MQTSLKANVESTLIKPTQDRSQRTGQTQRIKVQTGFGCNASCTFCYYRALIHTKNLSIETLDGELNLALRLGYKDVDFSGGEPTIVPGIEQVIHRAKELKFRRINVISNGMSISNQKFYAKLVDSGLNETLFSLHGVSPETHEFLVRVPGSFQKVTDAMKNANDLGVTVRTNITINKFNFKDLEEYVNYVLKFEPENMNFIFLNPWTTDDVNAKELFAKYDEAIPYLLNAMKILEDTSVKVAVRYVPYCTMPSEYRGHIVNLWNRQYDTYEWGDPFTGFSEYVAYNFINEGGSHNIDLAKEWLKYKIKTGISSAARLALKRPTSVVDGLFLRNDSQELSYGYMVNDRVDACSKCSIKNICEGVKREYINVFGQDEFKPLPFE